MNSEEIKTEMERIRNMQDYLLEREKSTNRDIKILSVMCIIMCGLLCVFIPLLFIFGLVLL